MTIYLADMHCGSPLRQDRSLKAVDIYTAHAGRWRSGKSLQQCRSSSAVCELDRKIYCLGGRDLEMNTILNSAEVLDLTTQAQWTTIPDMPIKCFGAGAFVVREHSFVGK